MAYSSPTRLAEYLAGVRQREGYDAARDIVADWLDCLEEMAAQGENTAELHHHVQNAANVLNIAIARAPK
jgi:hypothetical protein